MTVAGILSGIVATLIIIILVFGIKIYFETKTNATIILILAGLFLITATWIGLNWYYKYTASGARALKTQESNFSKGLERTIRIYDIEGDLVETYNGKLDIEYDDDRILFDDENGKRHVIYYGQDTVLIDEK